MRTWVLLMLIHNVGVTSVPDLTEKQCRTLALQFVEKSGATWNSEDSNGQSFMISRWRRAECHNSEARR